ncbi:hypothetical protein E3N88_28389 [Mikania micrantha]|uniref:Uncharacterized protein n=1 Tax=Mikania micrantha TaxID=192012 RepID=A0A5N6MZM0_9ASTR|nr:hypothetical protein E3N88_28389 [Mikania micrantha]
MREESCWSEIAKSAAVPPRRASAFRLDAWGLGYRRGGLPRASWSRGVPAYRLCDVSSIAIICMMELKVRTGSEEEEDAI